MSNTITSPAAAPAHDENQLMAERREKLKVMRQHQADGKGVAFPNDVKPEHRAEALFAQYDDKTKEELVPLAVNVSVAGRMMLKRVMGKASFATLQDASFGPSGGRIQVYINNEGVGEEVHNAFKHWDLGDIVAATGTLFKTKTGELSIHATSIRLITKSLRPLPDKFHGVADQEVKYRQRYVDLITDEAARKRFAARSKAVSAMRNFMVDNDFLEVETPMLHPIPGGANAKPFVTHHNALDQQMFLRIAPELYLKRLIVGGFERVFEINRSFRNEGISVRHNPEFTMMEFYAAWWNYEDLMSFTEDLIRHVATRVTGGTQLSYQGRPVDLGQPFERLTIREAILKHTDAGAHVDDAAWLLAALKKLGKFSAKDRLDARSLPSLQVTYFEELVEEKLWQPTFIMEHPTEISPLARANDARPEVTERFELYITGREFGNGFSELNDAEDQAARFLAQSDAKDGGDEEAMHYDADYVRALEYGMPPTGGCGIGIDRLMMLLTDSASIRDVILFPALRHEA
ncbi:MULTISPECIES: lysine--tRNA ligase [unclassified Polaromonas]|jgi:lysyl-tRNA synthetase class 2|uniref:lysine--tRNA ligase n=1 Tax=unclassified Polaromonas TaxID=2638319 RepID=UPI000BCE4646|nr:MULTISPECIES: lysine--tRNA ligase [unclassified Polaromonas]MDO9258944.1 lysine--tRNA ligase [Polaromonas sp.]OYY36555.1 MAG: lysine--tRNA ligase [Polaromonas sp. 35-63-35]OYZ22792.1 MAG: lysine--tRNA ligase [Polaromonas sp. 16-63-31]OYZ80996.1 MAG: lysine--tRNA ligase [Polaromonas sp. 24-63-21]OZA52786.1 MAG: lysine--tRNA ligase [Polaromonas sp. 17-63-33]